jgi:N utilization substance protein B
MLSRRQLRIKTLLSLYAFFQSEGQTDLQTAEKELFRSIDKVHELYFFLLLFLTELAHEDMLDAEDVQKKFFPKAEEVHAKNRLHQVAFLKALQDSAEFKSFVTKFGLSWQKDPEVSRKVFLDIKKSELYQMFMRTEKPDEKDFLLQILRHHIEDSEVLKGILGEQNIYWQEDLSFCFHLVIKTIKDYYDSGQLQFSSLYKDPVDDKQFVKELFEKTILNNKNFSDAIAAKTKNWEVDRIAMMDILLMKMALAEMITFPSIPIKVSINEYIDISKDYSTPKSKTFINGIIDKLAAEYKESGRIAKSGRGLVE